MTLTIGRAAAFACLLVASAAHAQAYRCSAGGSTYFSDRPCGTGSSSKLGSYGPTRSAAPSTYSPQLADAPKAQDHVRYLGSGCASISEAIRTGPTRGVRGDVLRGLHEEYNQKCALEDQEARRQVSDERSQQNQQKLAQLEGVKQERQQARMRSEQCTGMKEVIVLKRKRESELNTKEVQALRDLEKGYNERCIGS